MINPDYNTLRSPAEVLEGMRARHPEYLDDIHAWLDVTEMLIQRIANEGGSPAVEKSFQDLADRLSELRADYLAPADADLKAWQRSRGEL